MSAHVGLNKVVFFLLLAIFVPHQAKAETGSPLQAGFDCKAARTLVEKTICQDDGLKAQDTELNIAYQKELSAATSEGAKNSVKENERKWLASRETICGLTSDPNSLKALGDPVDCLSDLYQKRMKVLELDHLSARYDDSTNKHFPIPHYPYTPKLMLSKNEKLCSVFENAVQQDYIDSQSSRGGAFGFDALLRKEISLPEGIWLPEDSGSHLFSLKNNGHTQTVLLRSRAFRGVTYEFLFYIKDGEPTAEETQSILDGDVFHDDDLMQEGWKLVFMQEGTNNFPFHVLRLNDSLYLLRDGSEEYKSANKFATQPAPVNAVGLYQIQTNGDLDPTCLVSAAPLVGIGEEVYILDHKLKETTDQPLDVKTPEPLDEFFNDLNAIDVSGMGHCGGTGTPWTWFFHDGRRDYARYVALARPWENIPYHTLHLGQPGQHSSSYSDMHGTEALAYINSWGLDNLFNYKIYRRITENLPKAKDALADFYEDQFDLGTADAKDMADASMDKIFNGMLQIGIQYHWDQIEEDNLDANAFKKQYRLKLSNSERLPENYIRKAILLNMKELIKDTPTDQISALNDAKMPKGSWGPNPHEPVLFYGLDNPEMTQLLLSKGANANAVNWFGKTPLMYAAQWDLPEISKILINAHANVNSATTPPPDKYTCWWPSITERTALMYAAENASAPTIEMLLEASADLKAQDSDERGIASYLANNQVISDEERQKIKTALQ